jgi:protein O-mannosyl-transferase
VQTRDKAARRTSHPSGVTTVAAGAANPWSSPRWGALVCALLAFAIHVNSFKNQFAYDDVQFLPENTALHDIRNLPGLLAQPYWPGDFAKEIGLWRPATTLTFGIEWALFQNHGAPYHVVNVLAHAAATALVVLLIGTLAAAPIAFVSGLIFAVHPMHVEAVSNIVGIAELQAAILFLAACLLHARAAPALAPPTREGTARYGTGRLVTVTLLYLGAFFSKESAITLPGVFLLLDAARERLGLRDVGLYARRRAPVYGALAGAAALALALRWMVLGSLAHPLDPLGADLLQAGVPRIWTVAAIWTHYVRLIVFPLNLSPDYSPNVLPIELGWHARNLVGLVLGLSFLAAAWLAFRARTMDENRESARLVGFGVMWWIVTISPISNVFFLAGVLLAERTLYLPSVGAVAVGGWLVFRLIRRRRILGWAFVGTVVGLLGLRTWLRTPSWHDSETVLKVMVEQYPESGRSQWVLGNAFYVQGRVPEAMRAYRAAIGILGGHHQLMIEMGKKLIDAKRYRAADFILLQAWQQEPSWGVAPAFLAVSRLQQGDWATAERHARASLALAPDQAITEDVLSSALAAQGRFAEAIPWREAAIEHGLGDSWEQWMTLAQLKVTVGDLASAELARDSAMARATTAEERTRIGSQIEPLAAPSALPLDSDSTAVLRQ